MTAVTLTDGALHANKWLNGAGGTLNPVINFAHFRYTTYNVVSISTAVYDTPISITYTPRFANSLLLVEGSIPTRYINSFGIETGIKRDGVNTGQNYNGNIFFAYKSDQANHHTDCHMHVVVPANNTNATTFTLWVKAHNYDAEFFGGLGGSYIQVWELQQ